ncbi:pyrroline-5-carboxylate reductase [Clostridium puniceum]|uniref:Pyrroline-5-carboxylate reductase n=1 Tax=Clostridium puniceum TaxID=29367 RepID=A0A1S8TND8_9CLOT|nr:pyrroline-5-carboxylate reductase [Clostridium puniceum]OOM79293.1 pyrroline-5-carboxylate reductase [Clostridium puniceum]
MIEKKIGFIGCGNMGRAILDGIISSGVINSKNINVYDISPNVIENSKAKNVNISANIKELCEESDIILLAIKPNIVEEVLKSTERLLEGKALLSIVAGVTSENLKKMANVDIRILRIMPNTPAMVGEGATVFCLDNTFSQDEKNLAVEIFESVGIVEWIPEKLIDAVTGLSGGGPAYAAMFIEALADGGVREGLSRATSYRLAAQTVLGTGKMIIETGIHPGELKDMVSSPAGTTIEGVRALEKGGMRFAVLEAIAKSSEKSRNLCK